MPEFLKVGEIKIDTYELTNADWFWQLQGFLLDRGIHVAETDLDGRMMTFVLIESSKERKERLRG